MSCRAFPFGRYLTPEMEPPSDDWTKRRSWRMVSGCMALLSARRWRINRWVLAREKRRRCSPHRLVEEEKEAVVEFEPGVRLDVLLPDGVERAGKLGPALRPDLVPGQKLEALLDFREMVLAAENVDHVVGDGRVDRLL